MISMFDLYRRSTSLRSPAAGAESGGPAPATPPGGSSGERRMRFLRAALGERKSQPRFDRSRELDGG